MRVALILACATSLPGAVLAPATATASTFSQLAKFSGKTSGTNPTRGMILDAAGNLYGVTYFGGNLYTLTRPAPGKTKWSLVVPFRFPGGAGGSLPGTHLLPGPNGVLYGTTNAGGTNNVGVVYQLTPPVPGQPVWTEQILYNAATADGFPDGDLVSNGAGSLIGTSSGGAGKNSSGVVYELTPPTGGQIGWTYNVIYNFQGAADGIAPYGGLLRDKSGVFYGVTSGGGTGHAGTVFSLAPPSQGQTVWTKTILYNFNGNDGKSPFCDLVKVGNALYGTTSTGGANNQGEVFQLKPPAKGGGAWRLAVLYSFSGGVDGGEPYHGLTVGAGGALYGVTEVGGAYKHFGTVFRLTPPPAGQTNWTETTLHSFDNKDGNSPTDLVRDSAGNLYGNTEYSSGGNTGTAFQVTP